MFLSVNGISSSSTYPVRSFDQPVNTENYKLKTMFFAHDLRCTLFAMKNVSGHSDAKLFRALFQASPRALINCVANKGRCIRQLPIKLMKENLFDHSST